MRDISSISNRENAAAHKPIERRFVYRTASGNVLPYANVKNTGLFCVKDYCNHGHTGSYTLVTPKGKLYFAQLREMILLVS